MIQHHVSEKTSEMLRGINFNIHQVHAVVAKSYKIYRNDLLVHNVRKVIVIALMRRHHPLDQDQDQAP